jgi:hypothetical protein
MRKPSTTNAILLTIIGVLTIGLLVRGTGMQSAWAQDQPSVEPPFNAGEQRKQMILALQQMNSRMAAIESKLSGNISVKVVEMPPVTIKESPKK